MRRAYLAFFILIILCIFVIYGGFNSFFRYKAVNRTELTRINGTLEGWNYKKIAKSYDMIIKLQEYPVDFCIWSVSLSALDKRFESSVNVGNRVHLLILRTDLEDLSLINTKIDIYGLYSSGYEYLNLDNINQKQKGNVKIGLVMGCVFIVLLGFLILLFFKYIL